MQLLLSQTCQENGFLLLLCDSVQENSCRGVSVHLNYSLKKPNNFKKDGKSDCEARLHICSLSLNK